MTGLLSEKETVFDCFQSPVLQSSWFFQKICKNNASVWRWRDSATEFCTFQDSLRANLDSNSSKYSGRGASNSI